MTKTAGRGGLPSELSVGEVAARTGVAVSALHFYEASGLIRSRRSAGNQRRYPREVLRRVGVIKAAQRLGVRLETIGAALSNLPENRPPQRTGGGCRRPGGPSWTTGSPASCGCATTWTAASAAAASR